MKQKEKSLVKAPGRTIFEAIPDRFPEEMSDRMVKGNSGIILKKMKKKQEEFWKKLCTNL